MSEKIGRTPFNEVCLFLIHGDEVYPKCIWVFGEAFGWIALTNTSIFQW